MSTLFNFRCTDSHVWWLLIEIDTSVCLHGVQVIDSYLLIRVHRHHNCAYVCLYMEKERGENNKCACMHVCVCVCVFCVYVYVHVCVHACMYVCVHIHVNIHM